MVKDLYPIVAAWAGAAAAMPAPEATQTARTPASTRFLMVMTALLVADGASVFHSRVGSVLDRSPAEHRDVARSRARRDRLASLVVPGGARRQQRRHGSRHRGIRRSLGEGVRACERQTGGRRGARVFRLGETLER